MKNLITFAAAILILVPGIAKAGPLTDKAYQVAAQLGVRETSLSPAQQAQVNRDLDHLLTTLAGQPGAERSYFCTSRDNDNNRPFVIAYKDFANIVRINSAVLDSKEDCEKSLAGSQRFMDRVFACASRDNDGMRPFKIVALNGTPSALMLQRSALSNLDDCATAVQAMQLRPEGVLYCGSRDNDGSRPFTQTGYKFDGTFMQSREEYDSLGTCNANL